MSKRHPSSQVRSGKSTGLAARSEAHNRVLRNGGSRRQAVGAYCQGNKWLTENAKAVGNL
jgi:hypothetical protein